MKVEAEEVVAAVGTQSFLVSLAGEELLVVKKDQQGKNKGTGYFMDGTPLHNPILPPTLLNFPLHLLADLHPGRAGIAGIRE